MALMYVPDAVPSGVASTANLGQQLLDKPTVGRNLKSPTPGRHHEPALGGLRGLGHI